MKTLARSDLSVLKTTILDDNIVECSLTVRKNKDTNRVQIDSWKFDFENVTKNEERLLAVKTCKIVIQREMTKSKDFNNPKVWENRTISVRKIIDEQGKREKVDSVTAFERARDKLSEDEQDAQLEKMIADRAKRVARNTSKE